MAEFYIPGHGTICWRELATSDLSAAKNFYREMFGWDLVQSKITQLAYPEIHIRDVAVGGMMEIDESWGENPPPSHWTAYIAVSDANEAAARITENGGIIRHGPFDAPGVGRIALVTDPCGANFAIIQFEGQA
jgi:predicted enzyme related to lactoylglutathione lyase